MYEIFDFIYTLICYIGIALSIVTLLFTDKRHRCSDHVVPHSFIGISWMLCLYIPHSYGLVLTIFNILLLTYIPIYEVYNDTIRKFNYRRI